jgi:hypothetical protein
MTSNWIVYVIEGRGSGHCHEAGLTVLILNIFAGILDKSLNVPEGWNLQKCSSRYRCMCLCDRHVIEQSVPRMRLTYIHPTAVISLFD